MSHPVAIQSMRNAYAPTRVSNAVVRVSGSLLFAFIVVMIASLGLPAWVHQIIATVAGYLIALLLIAAVTGLVMGPVARKKLRERVLATRAHMCPKCAYDLTARSPDDHTCPECGLVCPRRECVRLWCKLIRSRI